MLSLLKIHEDVEKSRFLGVGAQDPGLQPPALESVLGEIAGTYKILDVLGEGGMAVVYLAEQRSPVYRKVAVKVMKLGLDSGQVLGRFETERQALALMDHPSIAKVFDAGTTEGARPFFVMEYVNGIPITDFCARHHLGREARLDLYMQVCHAVQHSHQKGIIHRDIKPSNVLISTEADEPLPKVIDFGIAKATSQPLTQKTLFTGQGQVVGTPGHISPEQLEGGPLSVDTRADIYSLGVLLYELLTGTLPFEADLLGGMSPGEMRQTICEVDPPAPSTRVRNLAVDASSTEALTPIPPRELRGDLNWITMKAMDKTAARRYATASELAADIGRHLRHEPVVASPPSVLYRARKFNRRHQVSVAVVALFLLVGVAFGLGSAALYRQLRWESLETLEMYHAAFDAASDAMMTFDIETGKFIEANEATLSLYGYSRDEFLRATVFDISAEPDKTRSAVRRLARGDTVKAPRVFVRKDGSRFRGDAFGARFNWMGRSLVIGVVRHLEELDGPPEEAAHSGRGHL